MWMQPLDVPRGTDLFVLRGTDSTSQETQCVLEKSLIIPGAVFWVIGTRQLAHSDYGFVFCQDFKQLKTKDAGAKAHPLFRYVSGTTEVVP
jgi:hypothetical protein